MFRVQDRGGQEAGLALLDIEQDAGAQRERQEEEEEEERREEEEERWEELATIAAGKAEAPV